MKRTLAAALVSGAVGLVLWLIVALIVPRLLGVAEAEERAFGGIVLFPVALFMFVLAPLVAGLIGGLVGRSFVSLAGSIVGYLAVVVTGTMIISGGSTGPGLATILGLGIPALLVTAGHLAGVAVRPRLRPA